ncbi:WW domain-containing oxidoreductase [Talaromyces islandicus]|uniref:WW domain-containing oxidoreductase n=1 Tax=Talaromyces islandicus TaxID=28573 RepID=A0A0U1M8M6_TALIS|nr:WW domain-containing oxidoreductase [Talaromyces islandicus]
MRVGQPIIPPTPEATNLEGKTVLVTGANSGIGLESARQFLTLKAARVILTARDHRKGGVAVSALRSDPEVLKSNPSATIEVFDLDLDDYQSGLDFCKRVESDVPYLDVLVCNAGRVGMKYESSTAGHERVMQVNCYTHFFIILKLLPLLRKTALNRNTPSRVTFVGSEMQKMNSFSSVPAVANENILEHLDDRNLYQPLKRYGDSKLIVNAFVRHLATLVPDTEVIINNLCPGLVATDLDNDSPLLIRGVMYIFRKIAARTVEEGSRTVIYASVVCGQETHGKFLTSNLITDGAPFWKDSANKDFPERLYKGLLADFIHVDSSLQSV